LLQQPGALAAQSQGHEAGAGVGSQQVARALQGFGAGHLQVVQVFVAGLDDVRLGQGRVDLGSVGGQVGHDGGAQVGVHHHAEAGGALGLQPGPVNGGVARIQGQGTGADHLQCPAVRSTGGVEPRSAHGAVGHTFAVEGVVGVAVPGEVDHGQRGDLAHGSGQGQLHAIGRELRREFTAPAVT